MIMEFCTSLRGLVVELNERELVEEVQGSGGSRSLVVTQDVRRREYVIHIVGDLVYGVRESCMIHVRRSVWCMGDVYLHGRRSSW